MSRAKLNVHLNDINDIEVSSTKHDNFDTLQIKLGDVQVTVFLPDRNSKGLELVQEFQKKVLALNIRDSIDTKDDVNKIINAYLEEHTDAESI
jgi:hypothetical protein